MVEKDKIYTLEVEDFANEGKSIARIDNFVVFIYNAIPGDLAEVKIYKTKKSHAFGKVINVLRNSEKRIDPKCKYFGVCGGCKWQNMNYQTQLGYKRDSIYDSFERIGKMEAPEVLEPIGSDNIFYFRNKMEYSFSDKRWLLESEKEIEDKSNDFALGLHIPERFDKVLDIDECFLQSANSVKILNFTREFAIKNGLKPYSPKLHQGYFRNLVIREAKNTNEFMINVVTYEDFPEIMNKYSDEILNRFDFVTTIVNNVTSRKSQVATGEFEKVYHGSGAIHEKLGKYVFSISANSFFQTNTLGAEKLYEVVKNLLPEGRIDRLWDLYCGAGTISIYLSERCNHITGFEIVESAVSDAEKNVKMNNVSNCAYVAGDLKETIKSYSDITPDVIILDPPRNGVHPDVVQAVIDTGTKQIIYVSCNPQTQARDLEVLCNTYNAAKIQPVDMFPHTMHIENVVNLIRK